MSRTTSKRRRFARSQARRRCRALRQLAIIIDKERRRLTPPSTGQFAFLDGLARFDWPYGSTITGTIGGARRQFTPFIAPSNLHLDRILFWTLMHG